MRVSIELANATSALAEFNSSLNFFILSCLPLCGSNFRRSMLGEAVLGCPRLPKVAQIWVGSDIENLVERDFLLLICQKVLPVWPRSDIGALQRP